jgi:hypothetical protein
MVSKYFLTSDSVSLIQSEILLIDILFLHRNKQTEANIRKKEQEKPGIITSDGVVIDGNRRLMCLNRIVNKPEKLDAIIVHGSHGV